jgi:hypothetical protein
MGEIRFRLAKPSDAKQIANVHYHVRENYAQGFFAHVNFSFLIQYYKVILNDPSQIVVCAEVEGSIVGFSSGSLDVSNEFKNIRKHKFSFVIPLLNSAFFNPKIIKAAIDRFKSTGGNRDKEFVSMNGARNEFWAWLPNRDDSYMSIYTQELMLFIMKQFGVKEVYGEMDIVNERIVKLQTRNGSKIQEKITLPDGRVRIRCVMDLDEHKFKLLR